MNSERIQIYRTFARGKRKLEAIGIYVYPFEAPLKAWECNGPRRLGVVIASCLCMNNAWGRCKCCPAKLRPNWIVLFGLSTQFWTYLEERGGIYMLMAPSGRISNNEMRVIPRNRSLPLLIIAVGYLFCISIVAETSFSSGRCLQLTVTKLFTFKR